MEFIILNNSIKEYIKESIDTKQKILTDEKLVSKIDDVATKIIDAYRVNQKVLVAGNGGSAADAQHIVAELVSKFSMDRPALNALALTTNTSILTAVGNDYNHDYIFSRQVEAYGNTGDIFVAISTSGNSKNIIKAIEIAKQKGLYVVGLTGVTQSQMDSLCDSIIKVPSNKTPIIQESHIMIGHIICGIVEREIF